MAMELEFPLSSVGFSGRVNSGVPVAERRDEERETDGTGGAELKREGNGHPGDETAELSVRPAFPNAGGQ